MSSTPARYQANPRLIDQPDELRRLYVEEELTIREIADNHAEVSRSAVGDALQEYGITDGCDASNHESHTARGLAPPQSGGAANSPVQWSNIT